MPDSKNQAAARAILQAFIAHGGPILREMFNTYRRFVMPPDAGSIQVLECKRAFFAGARSLLDLMMIASDPGDEVTATDEKIMAVIDAELDAFMNEGQMREHVAAAPETLEEAAQDEIEASC